MSAHTSLCAWPIYQYGNENTKGKIFNSLTKGERIGAFGLDRSHRQEQE